MADSTPAAKGLSIDELKNKLKNMLPNGGATIRQTVEIAYKIKNEKHVKNVLTEFSQLAGEPEEKLKSIIDFMNNPNVQNKQLLSNFMDKDSLVKSIEAQYQGLEKLFKANNVKFGSKLADASAQDFANSKMRDLELSMQTYKALYGKDLPISLPNLDTSKMNFTREALAPIQELQRIITEFAQNLGNNYLEEAIQSMSRSFSQLSPNNFGQYLSSLTYNFSKQDSLEASLRSKYDVDLESFKKEISSLFNQEQSLLEKAYDNDLDEDEALKALLESKKVKMEAYKYITGQKRRGGTQWEQAQDFLKNGLDVQRALQLAKQSGIGGVIEAEHSGGIAYLNGYTRYRKSVLNGGMNPSDQFSDAELDKFLYELSVLEKGLAASNPSKEYGIASMLSKVQRFGSLLSTIKEMEKQIKLNPNIEYGFTVDNAGKFVFGKGNAHSVNTPSTRTMDSHGHSHPNGALMFSYPGHSASGKAGDLGAAMNDLNKPGANLHWIMSSSNKVNPGMMSLMNLLGIPVNIRKDFLDNLPSRLDSGSHFIDGKAKASQISLADYENAQRQLVQSILQDYGIYNPHSVFSDIRVKDLKSITSKSINQALETGTGLYSTKKSGSTQTDISQETTAINENTNAIQQNQEIKSSMQQSPVVSATTTEEIKQETKAIADQGEVAQKTANELAELANAARNVDPSTLSPLTKPELKAKLDAIAFSPSSPIDWVQKDKDLKINTTNKGKQSTRGQEQIESVVTTLENSMDSALDKALTAYAKGYMDDYERQISHYQERKYYRDHYKSYLLPKKAETTKPSTESTEGTTSKSTADIIANTNATNNNTSATNANNNAQNSAVTSIKSTTDAIKEETKAIQENIEAKKEEQKQTVVAPVKHNWTDTQKKKYQFSTDEGFEKKLPEILKGISVPDIDREAFLKQWFPENLGELSLKEQKKAIQKAQRSFFMRKDQVFLSGLRDEYNDYIDQGYAPTKVADFRQSGERYLYSKQGATIFQEEIVALNEKIKLEERAIEIEKQATRERLRLAREKAEISYEARQQDITDIEAQEQADKARIRVLEKQNEDRQGLSLQYRLESITHTEEQEDADKAEIQNLSEKIKLQQQIAEQKREEKRLISESARKSDVTDVQAVAEADKERLKALEEENKLRQQNAELSRQKRADIVDIEEQERIDKERIQALEKENQLRKQITEQKISERQQASLNARLDDIVNPEEETAIEQKRLKKLEQENKSRNKIVNRLRRLQQKQIESQLTQPVTSTDGLFDPSNFSSESQKLAPIKGFDGEKFVPKFTEQVNEQIANVLNSVFERAGIQGRSGSSNVPPSGGNGGSGNGGGPGSNSGNTPPTKYHELLTAIKDVTEAAKELDKIQTEAATKPIITKDYITKIQEAEQALEEYRNVLKEITSKQFGDSELTKEMLQSDTFSKSQQKSLTKAFKQKNDAEEAQQLNRLQQMADAYEKYYEAIQKQALLTMKAEPGSQSEALLKQSQLVEQLAKKYEALRQEAQKYFSDTEISNVIQTKQQGVLGSDVQKLGNEILDSYKKSLVDSLQSMVNIPDLNVGNTIPNLIQQIETLRNSLNSGSVSWKDFIQNLQNIGQETSNITAVSSALDPLSQKLITMSQDINNHTQIWKDKFTELQTAIQGLFDNRDDADSVNNYKEKIKQIIQELNNLNKATLLNNKQGKLFNEGEVKSVDDLIGKLDEFAKKNNLVATSTAPVIDSSGKVTMVLRNNAEQIVKVKASYDELNKGMRVTTQTMASTGGILKTLGSGFVGLAKSFGQLTGLSMLAMRVRSEITQGLTTFKQYDATLTNISYTMNLTSKELQNMGKSAIQMAKDLSMSVANAEDVYKIYANMNTTAEDIQRMAKPTVILSNLSGVDASTAADEVQGIIQQFNMLKDTEEDVADISMHVVDVLDNISANIAMDYSKGISVITQAVTATGQVAHDAGMSFEQLAAISAKVAERTREDGSTIGNAMKTIITRISKVNKMPQYADEVDNETLSKASESLHAIGVEVYKSNGEMNDMITILTNLREKWDTLSDAQQANIAFNIAATRQTSKFKNILEAWTDAMTLAENATVTSGNALANQEKYADSITGKLQSLRTEMDAFWIDLYNSDAAKNVLDFLKGLLKGITTLGKHIGQLQTLLLLLTGLSVIGARGKLFGTKDKAGALSFLFSNPKALTGIVLTITAITAVIIGLTKAYDTFSQSTDALIKRNNKLIESQQKAADVHKKVIKENDDNADSLQKLLEQYEQAEEGSQEYYNIRSLIAEQSPELIIGYDSEGRAIIAGTEAIRNRIQAYREMADSEKRLMRQEASKNIQDSIEGTSDFVSNGARDLINKRNKLVAENGTTKSVGRGAKRQGEYEWYENVTVDNTEEIKAIDDQLLTLQSYWQSQYALLAGDVTDLNQTQKDALTALEKIMSQSGAYGIDFTREWNRYRTASEEQQKAFSEQVNNLLNPDLSEIKAGDNTYSQIMKSRYLTLEKLLGLNDEQKAELKYQLKIDVVQEEINQQIDDIISNTDYQNIANNIGFNLEKAIKDSSVAEIELFNPDNFFSNQAKKAIESRFSETLKEIRGAKALDLFDLDTSQIELDSVQTSVKNLATILQNFKVADSFNSAIDLMIKFGWVVDNTVDGIKNDFESFRNEMSLNITTMADAESALNTALGEMNKNGVITKESFNALTSANNAYADALVVTSQGMQLNVKQAKKVRREERRLQKEKLDKYYQDLNDEFTTNADKLAKCEAWLKKNTDASTKAYQSTLNQKNALLLAQQAIQGNISSLQQLRAELSTSTSAYADWQAAINGGSFGDQYNTITGWFDTFKDLHEKGWVGNEAYEAFVTMFTGIEDFGLGSGAGEYGKMIMDFGEKFFTEDDKGPLKFLEVMREALQEGGAEYESWINEDGSLNIHNTAEMANILTNYFREHYGEKYSNFLMTEELYEILAAALTEAGLGNYLDREPDETLGNQNELEKSLDRLKKEQEELGESSDEYFDQHSPRWKELQKEIERTEQDLYALKIATEEITSQDDIDKITEGLKDNETITKKGIEIPEIPVTYYLVEDTKKDLSSLESARNALFEKYGEIPVDQWEEEDQAALQSIYDLMSHVLEQKHELEQPWIMSVDTSTIDDEGFAQFVSKVQEYQEAVNNYDTAKTKYGVDSTEAQQAKETISGLTQELLELDKASEGQYSLKLGIDFLDDSSISEQLKSIFTFSDSTETKDGIEVKVWCDEEEVAGVVNYLQEQLSGVAEGAKIKLTFINDTQDTYSFALQALSQLQGASGVDISWTSSDGDGVTFKRLDNINNADQNNPNAVWVQFNDVTGEASVITKAEDLNKNGVTIECTAPNTSSVATLFSQLNSAVDTFNQNKIKVSVDTDPAMAGITQFRTNVESTPIVIPVAYQEEELESPELPERVILNRDANGNIVGYTTGGPVAGTAMFAGIGVHGFNHPPTGQEQPTTDKTPSSAEVAIKPVVPDNAGELVETQLEEKLPENYEIPVETVVEESSPSLNFDQPESQEITVSSGENQIDTTNIQNEIDRLTDIQKTLKDQIATLETEVQGQTETAAAQTAIDLGGLYTQLSDVNKQIEDLKAQLPNESTNMGEFGASESLEGLVEVSEAADQASDSVDSLSEKETGEVGTSETITALNNTTNAAEETAEAVQDASQTNLGDVGANETASALRNATSEVRNFDSAFTSLDGKTSTATLIVNQVGGAGSWQKEAKAQGTTKWSFGRALASGNDIGASKTEDALVGELGPEMRVRGSKWELLGENGPEFRNIKKGDIIFNHQQTADLLSHGSTNTRGKAFGYGTGGSAYGGLFGNTRMTDGGGGYSHTTASLKEQEERAANGIGSAAQKLSDASDDLSGSAGDVSDASEEAKSALDELKEKWGRVIDWVEVKLNDFQKKLDKFIARGERTDYKRKEREKEYRNAINKITPFMDAANKAATTYANYAENVLKEGKSKVDNNIQKEIDEAINLYKTGGEYNIKEYSEDARTVIDEWKKWYDLQLEQEDRIFELETQRLELIKERAQVRVTEDENEIEHLNSVNDKIKSIIDARTDSGFFGVTTQYTKLLDNTKLQTKYLNDQIIAWTEAQKSVKKGTEAWWEYQTSIDEAEGAMYGMLRTTSDLVKELKDLKNAKIEASNELLKTREEAASTAKNKNSFIMQQNANLGIMTKNEEEAYKAAQTSTEKATKSLKKQTNSLLNATKAKKEYQSALNKAKKNGANVNKTVYGNIDLNKRQVLKNKDGSISTVLGTSAEYDGVEIAYSPLLQTKKGAKKLNQKTIDQYINALIQKAGKNWTTEDLLKLDKQGLKIGKQKISGLIADVGKTARDTAKNMHYVEDVRFAKSNLNGKVNKEHQSLVKQIKKAADGEKQIPFDLIQKLQDFIKKNPSDRGQLDNILEAALKYNGAILAKEDSEQSYEISKLNQKIQAEANAEAMKANIEAERDKSIDKGQSLFNTVSGLFYSSTDNGANARQAEEKQLEIERNAFSDSSKLATKDLSRTKKSANSKIKKALKDGKINKKYKKALQNAQTSMNSKQPVKESDIEIIQTYNPTLAGQLYLWNFQLEDTEEIRLAEVQNYTTYSTRMAELAQENFDKQNESLEKAISKNDAKNQNATSAAERNAFLARNNFLLHEKDNVSANRVRSFSQKATSNAQTIKKQALSIANANPYKKDMLDAANSAKNGEDISTTTLKNLAKGFSEREVSEDFYQACYDYHTNYQHYLDAVEAKEIEDEANKQQRAANYVQMARNINEEGDQKRNLRTHGAVGDLLGSTKNGTNKTSFNRQYAEASGYYTDEQDIRDDIETAQEDLKQYIEDYNSAYDIFLKAIRDGVEEGTPEWYELQGEVEKAREGIDQTTLSIKNLQNEARQLSWTKFDDLIAKIDRINTEINHFKSVIANELKIDKKGNLTQFGVASLLLDQEQIQVDINEAKRLAKERAKIEEQLLGDPENQDLQKRRNDLLDQEYAKIQDIASAQQEQIDTVRQVYEGQLNYLNKTISKYNELKQSEKEAYDYQKNISEQAENITNLQRQLEAFEGNTSEESIATVQKLRKDLKDAEQGLKDTQYDKYLSDAQNMLEDLATNFQEWIDDYLSDRDQVLKDISLELSGQTDCLGADITSASNATEQILALLKKTEEKMGVEPYVTPSLQDAMRDQKGIGNYASGAKITSSQNAWTQENGSEVIYRAKDGAMLTPLNNGDMVFSHAMSENLWNLAKMNIPELIERSMSQPIVNNKQDVTISPNTNIQMSITLPNVKNYEEFRQAMLNDRQFQNGIQEMTLGAAMGRNSLSKRQYA